MELKYLLNASAEGGLMFLQLKCVGLFCVVFE